MGLRFEEQLLLSVLKFSQEEIDILDKHYPALARRYLQVIVERRNDIVDLLSKHRKRCP